MVEYALLVGVLGLGAAGALTFLRDEVRGLYDRTSAAETACLRAPGVDAPPCARGFRLENRDPTGPNGPGTEGQAEIGDRVVVVFSGRLKVQILCDGWHGDDTNQPNGYPIPPGRTGMNVVIADNPSSDIYGDPIDGPHNDRLRIGSPGGQQGTTCGGVFNFGEIDLGSPDFVTRDVTIEDSAVSWGGSSSFELIVTLGRVTDVAPVDSTTAIYYPSRVLEEPFGSLIFAPPVSSTGTHF